MDDNKTKIGIAEYYRKVVERERERDNECAKANKYNIDESVYQRASCYSALICYLDNRGFDTNEIHKIFLEEGKTASSGIENVIFFLETQFNKIPNEG